MDLKELLGEELYSQVVEKAGEHKIAIVSDGEWIPKEKFNSKLDDIKELKDEIKERDKQILELEKSATGNKDLEEQLNNAKKANEDWENKYKESQLNTAIKLAVAKEAKDANDILHFINKEGLELQEDGTVKGLEEAVNQLKESKSYLFGNDTLEGRDPHPPGDPKPIVENPFGKEHFNLTKQGELVANDPDKARELIKLAGGNPAIYGL